MADEYQVNCECGRPMGVSAREAGAARTCPCGRVLVVPSLRALRRAAGEADTLSPELLVRAMLHEGRIPDGTDCVACYAAAAPVRFARVDCERVIVEKPYGPLTILAMLFLPYGWLAAVAAAFGRTGRPPEPLGRDLAFVLPLRLCDRCASLRGEALAAAVRRVPLYDRLLTQFPDAVVTPDGGPARVI